MTQDRDRLEGVVSLDGDPALRDARDVITRIEVEQAMAEEARAEYQRNGLPTLPSEQGLDSHLHDGEVIHAIREGAVLNGIDSASPMPGYAGTLYLTSRRLLQVGQVVFSLALSDITELSLAGDRLLVTLRSGEGVSVDAAQPRLLRVQIAAALAGARA